MKPHPSHDFTLSHFIQLRNFNGLFGSMLFFPPQEKKESVSQCLGSINSQILNNRKHKILK